MSRLFFLGLTDSHERAVCYYMQPTACGRQSGLPRSEKLMFASLTSTCSWQLRWQALKMEIRKGIIGLMITLLVRICYEQSVT